MLHAFSFDPINSCLPRQSKKPQLLATFENLRLGKS